MHGARVGSVLIFASLLSLPAVPQAKNPRVVPPQQNQHNKNQQGQPARKMGDWLREHRNLTPAQQEKALESDPHFKNLSTDKQAALRERLRKFNSLPPQQQERALQRMEFMNQLSPDQRKQIRDANQQLEVLPVERKVMVHKALRHLRQMSPEERQQVLQSDKFRSTFSDQEQTILKNLAAIAPPAAHGF